MKGIVLAALLLTACGHTHLGVNKPQAGAAILAGMVISAAASDSSSAPAPIMDPDRAIIEQDCTKPIDLSAGNLRCR